MHTLAETVGEQGTGLVLHDRRLLELEGFRETYQPKVDAMAESDRIAGAVADALGGRLAAPAVKSRRRKVIELVTLSIVAGGFALELGARIAGLFR